MDGFQFQLNGIESLLGKLDAVKQETKYKGGRAALRKAAQIVRDAARQNAAAIDDPTTSEQISKNIVERWNGRLFKSSGDLGFRVGVLGGARQYANTGENRRKGRVGAEYKTDGDKSNPGGDTFYWRFVEFGTEKSPARPFMRPAMEQNISAATDAFIAEYEKAIDRAIKRGIKKGDLA